MTTSSTVEAENAPWLESQQQQQQQQQRFTHPEPVMEEDGATQRTRSSSSSTAPTTASSAHNDGVATTTITTTEQQKEQEDWTLHIKSVNTCDADFSIALHPNQSLAQLYQAVSHATGLSHAQQRLIYRGRILPQHHHHHHHHHHQQSPSALDSETTRNNNATHAASLLSNIQEEEDHEEISSSSSSSSTHASNKSHTKPQQQQDPPLESDAAQHPHPSCETTNTECDGTKVKDIVGLTDGHTIHLVRKPVCATQNTNDDTDTGSGRGDSANETTTTPTTTPSGATEDSATSSTAASLLSSNTATAALLAALLGGGGSSNNNNNHNTTEERRTPVANNINNNTRRPPFRLREEDWVRPDPGSLEPIQQGLLTLHTLASSSITATTVAATANTATNPATPTPPTTLPTHRQFYRGQWIDCRDTVNQWLEATIVAVVEPHEILRPLQAATTMIPAAAAGSLRHRRRRDEESTGPSPHAPTLDPVIAVTDLEGRRRLLLEACEVVYDDATHDHGDDDDDSGEQSSQHQHLERVMIDGVSYQQRSHSVPLLHIHYNGWPVRWDEWIRSDSERIRPFRTRTRHTGTHASPTVQNVMPQAPAVHFANPYNNANTADQDESNDAMTDRMALLPELFRVMTMAQEMLDRSVASNGSSSMTSALTGTSTTTNGLPWLPVSTGEAAAGMCYQHRELEALAPFLDRLGRTLTDAAPHIASLAAAVQQREANAFSGGKNADADEDDDDDGDDEEDAMEEHPRTLGGLLSLLSRDRRRNGQSVASSNAANPSSDVSASMASSTTTGGNEPTNIVDEEEEDEEQDDEEEEVADTGLTVIDPDHRDFATGLVNTTRGDTRRSGTNVRSGPDEITSLLGAYLAAASLGGMASIGFGGDGEGGGAAEGLGRLLRERGNGGGGIDIHIHAVVTAPGMDGGLSLAALTGGGGTATAFPEATPIVTAPATTTATATGALGSIFGPRDVSARRSSRRFRSSGAFSSTTVSNDDDAGIFAELYSETPDPIDPNGSTLSSNNGISLENSHQQRELQTRDDATVSHLNRSRSRSRSTRRLQAPNGHVGVNSSIAAATSSASQRNGSGMLRRFFRRQSDNTD